MGPGPVRIVRRPSLRRQRGVNPFKEMLTLALIVASVWLAIALGKQYLGAAWWQITLYVVAGLVLGVAGMALGNYSPILGFVLLLGVGALLIFL